MTWQWDWQVTCLSLWFLSFLSMSTFKKWPQDVSEILCSWKAKANICHIDLDLDFWPMKTKIWWTSVPNLKKVIKMSQRNLYIKLRLITKSQAIVMQILGENCWKLPPAMELNTVPNQDEESMTESGEKQFTWGNAMWSHTRVAQKQMIKWNIQIQCSTESTRGQNAEMFIC